MLHQNEGTNQESGRLEIQETGDLTHERSKGNPFCQAAQLKWNHEM